MKNSKRPSDVDREIKEIIGIKTDDSRPAVPVVLMKDEKPPSIDIVNKLLNTASLSDDDKLKSLIGIPPCVNVSVNVNVNKAAGSEANVPGIKPAQVGPPWTFTFPKIQCLVGKVFFSTFLCGLFSYQSVIFLPQTSFIHIFYSML